MPEPALMIAAQPVVAGVSEVSKPGTPVPLR